MKILLIVNASASSVTARGRVVIQKALSADHEVRVAATSRRGHATRLAQGAAASGTDVVVVLGGDGTLNEAANGLAGTSTALAPLPGGSTNVFARTLGLSDDPVEATATLLEALSKNTIRSVGLGSVNGRYFLFHTGIGFDAAVVEQVEKRSSLKRYAGHPLFMWSAVTTWLRHYDHRSPAFALHYPDGTIVDSPFAIVLNTNPYTYLGARPFDIAPDAGLQRPLAVVALRSLGLITLTRVAMAALRPGSGVGHSRQVHYLPDVTDVTVRGYRPFPYQVDGDHLGDAEELVFRYEPEILSLVTPDSRAVSR
ncbi:MAG: diacylglycerol kinase family protein [Acidimicrobiia bacterium]|nr:diacylglycerol kinase family protein [Acidimicrobiia bacterium]MDH5237932.1 diacylglycerol kinase family protein [Acidimicrobiia bacterium]